MGIVLVSLNLLTNNISNLGIDNSNNAITFDTYIQNTFPFTQNNNGSNDNDNNRRVNYSNINKKKYYFENGSFVPNNQLCTIFFFFCFIWFTP